jgi:dUTP pyrophosphatase
MNIKLLSPGAKVPTRGTQFSAGYDLYVPNDTIIEPGRNIVPLDISIALGADQEGHIRPRSGFAAKGFEGHELTETGYKKVPKRFNADVIQGTLDADYRGNVGVIVKSCEKKPFMVTAGTRIAQMVIEVHYSGDFTVVDELDDTTRGEGGFESTGTH